MKRMDEDQPIHLPVPRPVVKPPAATTSERGTGPTEELRRVEAAAKQYVEQQRQTASALTAWLSMQQQEQHQEEQLTIARAEETREARAVIARASTKRASGTVYLALGIAGGVLGGAVVKFLFGGGPS